WSSCARHAAQIRRRPQTSPGSSGRGHSRAPISGRAYRHSAKKDRLPGGPPRPWVEAPLYIVVSGSDTRKRGSKLLYKLRVPCLRWDHPPSGGPVSPKVASKCKEGDHTVAQTQARRTPRLQIIL